MYSHCARLQIHWCIVLYSQIISMYRMANNYFYISGPAIDN